MDKQLFFAYRYDFYSDFCRIWVDYFGLLRDEKESSLAIIGKNHSEYFYFWIKANNIFQAA